MKRATKGQYDEALALYESGGQYLLSEYAKKHGIESWETDEPLILKQSEKNKTN